ncbi:conserved Plasmodium protein, unknown function [Plasmodium relictum]|uniref:Uncharacterized protein n=1 Tax=Plasmodium relictum TaxID=85471 RepID=A0A1J1H6M9_PLARL|nr:conserved Plasmodium protein, unknown function [Plasmodium relictum]CRH00569.1 conserved Plasmodium protein, unknown function [Plasmodium relictum]
MEDKIKTKNEENLEYIKKYIGYALAKSLLMTMKTDSDSKLYNPLILISKHLKNFASFNEQKNKKKKILIKKLHSNNIKIHDEIHKNFSKKVVKDLYNFTSNEKNIEYENFTILINLIKDIFNIENAYIGKVYEIKDNKRNVTTLKFIYTSENCDIKNVLLDEKEINNIFLSAEQQKEDFLFEKNFLFPNIIEGKFFYETLNCNLFPNINPLYENKSYLNRIQHKKFAKDKKIFEDEHNNKEGIYKNDDLEDRRSESNIREGNEKYNENKEKDNENGEDDEDDENDKDEKNKSENENDEDEDEDEDEDDEDEDEKDDGNKKDANKNDEECKKDEVNENDEDNENKSNNKDNDHEYDNENGEINENENDENDQKEVMDRYEEKEIKFGNEKENYENYLLEILNLNLTYKCIYIYEIMERPDIFLYSYMKPGDFFCIPIIYYTFYNFHFLSKLYSFKKCLFFNSKYIDNQNCKDNSLNEYNKNKELFSKNKNDDKMLDEDNQKDIEKKNEKLKEKITIEERKKWIRPKFDFKNGKKIEICLCLDNRGSINKINKNQINNLINFSYFLITRIFLSEKKCIEEQVDYMIECEYGKEKILIEKLHSKMEDNNYEYIINKYKNKLTDHYYFNKSHDLIKYICILLWIQTKILKHQQKIFDIRKIKIECNKTFLMALFSCYIILEYDYSYFAFSNDILDYEWRKLILHINQKFLDKLISFNPIIFFQGYYTNNL